MAFVEHGELLACCATSSRRELVLLFLYPATPSSKAHLRLTVLDLMAGRLVPPAIDMLALEGPLPTMAVTPMVHALGTDVAVVVNGGKPHLYSLACGTLLNSSPEAPLALSMDADIGYTECLEVSPTKHGFVVGSTGSEADAVTFVMVSFRGRDAVSLPPTRRQLAACSSTVSSTRVPWDVQTMGRAAVAVLVHELVDAVLTVCSAAPK